MAHNTPQIPRTAAGSDYWYPTVGFLHYATLEDKLVIINKIIDVVASDTFFAEKAKKSILYTLTAGEK